MGREKQSWKSQWDEYCFPYPRIDGAERHNVTREGDAMLREHFCLHNWPSGHFESSAAGRVSHVSCADHCWWVIFLGDSDVLSRDVHDLSTALYIGNHCL
jgi:hypothetical protein